MEPSRRYLPRAAGTRRTPIRIRRHRVAGLALSAAVGLAMAPLPAFAGGAGPPATGNPPAPGVPAGPGPGPVARGANVHHGAGGEADANVCAYAATPGVAHCDARVRTDAHAKSEKPVRPGATPPVPAQILGNAGAYDPRYLESAYNDPSLWDSLGTAGDGETVAIVDAYDDPNVAKDLSLYRSYFGLPKCSAAPLSVSGKVPTGATGCSFFKVNQKGVEGSYPTAAGSTGWDVETSLDVEMVSAICPNCQILLVEANSDSFSDLATAAQEAGKLGADVVSNSYGAQEFSGETAYDGYYDQPGVAVAVAAGDSGYGVEYPAASPYVTSVGGTTLNQTGNTGSRDATATETVWSGTGSGCSAYEPQPSWQTGLLKNQSLSGCSHRIVADVSAVADPYSGVWVYDSYNSTCTGTGTDPANLSCFAIYGGTSVATPIISSFYALAGNHTLGSAAVPASYPYAAPAYGSSGALYPVTSGSNTYGNYLNTPSCTPSDLCVAYDDLGNVVASADPASTSPAPTWTVTPVDANNYLEGISCASTTLCVAVDDVGNVVVSTDPGSTSPAPTWRLSDVDGTNPLYGVSCTADPGASLPDLCVAYDEAGNVLAYNGTRWTRTAVDSGNYLDGVSCATTTLCVAVDNDGNAWVSTSPGASPPTWTESKGVDGANYLYAVSCSSTPGASPPGLCVAYDDAGNVLAYNGTGWTRTAVDSGNYLDGVSCASTTLCVAVDWDGNGVISTDPGAAHPVWTVAKADGTNYLYEVSCAATVCAAYDANNSVVAYNASTSSWTVTPVDAANYLDGVTCASTTLCVAADDDGNAVVSSDPGVTSPVWTVEPADTTGCSPGYLCTAGPSEGYNGPTGLGTPGGSPNSIAAFTAPAMPLQITTTSLPAGTVGTSYTQTLAAVGGKTSYTWSATSGLTDGLSLNPSSGVISGIPTSAQTLKFSVTVKDNSSPQQSATRALSISVNAAPPAFTISTSSPLPAGTAGKTYKQTLAASGGKTPYSWKVAGGGLPKGLSLNASGVISGTPRNTGTFTFTAEVTDSSTPTHKTAEKSLSLTIAN